MGIYRRHPSYCVLYGIYIRCASYCVLYGDLQKMYVMLCIVWGLQKTYIILCIVWGFTEDVHHTVYCFGIYWRCTSYCVLYGDLQKTYIILCIVWGFTDDVHHAVYCMGIYRRHTSCCVLYGIYIRCASCCVFYVDLQMTYIILCIVCGFTGDVHHTVYCMVFTEDIHHTVYCLGIYRWRTSCCVLYGDLQKTYIMLCIVWYLHKMCIMLCVLCGFTDDVHHIVYCMWIYRWHTSYHVLCEDLQVTYIILHIVWGFT